MKKIKERIKTWYYHWLARLGKVPVATKCTGSSYGNYEIKFCWGIKYKDDYTVLQFEIADYLKATHKVSVKGAPKGPM